MNLKRFKSAFMAFTIAATALSLQSCGNDEPDPEKNQPSEDVSEFVGGWSGSMGNFIFFDDGNAKLVGDKESGIASFGKWTFGAETKILATTVNNWQFVVTLKSDDTWAAISASGTGNYTFDRLNKFDYAYELMRGATYVAEDGETGTCGGFSSAILDSEYQYALNFPGLHGYIVFTADGSNKDNSFRYALYTKEYKTPYNGNGYYYFLKKHQGQAVFTNMHSSTKCKLEIKSNHDNPADVIKHTFTFNNTGK